MLRTEILGAAPTSPTPLHRSDHPCDLRQRLGREHGAHLAVTRLVPPDIRNGPELPKELGVITVDGERLTVEPFDLAVAPGDDGKPFGVGLDSEAIWLGRLASPERQSVVLGEGAISAAGRGARECGVSQRTAVIYSGAVPAPPRRRRSGRSLVGPIHA